MALPVIITMLGVVVIPRLVHLLVVLLKGEITISLNLGRDLERSDTLVENMERDSSKSLPHICYKLKVATSLPQLCYRFATR